MPLKKAHHDYLPESPDRNPPQMMEIMGWPTIKLRPKKVSNQEPPSLSLANFINGDKLSHIPGELHPDPVPLPDQGLPQPEAIVRPKTPEPEPKPKTPKPVAKKPVIKVATKKKKKK